MNRFITQLILCFLLLLTGFSLLQSQPLVRYFEDGDYILEVSQWSENEGLPTWHINDMIECKRGYIWMATGIGLIRFDGKTFSKMELSRPNQGTDSGSLRRVAEDINGNLWLIPNSPNPKIIVYDPILRKSSSIENYLGHEFSISELGYMGLYRISDTIYIFDPRGTGGRYTGVWEPKYQDVIHDAKNRTEVRRYFPRKDSLIWRWVRSKDEQLTLQVINRAGKLIKDQYFTAKVENFSFMDPNYQLYLYAHGDKISSYQLDTLYKINLDTIEAFAFGNYPIISLNNTSDLEPDYFHVNSEGYGLTTDGRTAFIFNKEDIIFPNLVELFQKNYDGFVPGNHFITSDNAFWFANNTGLFRLKIDKKKFRAYANHADGTRVSIRGIIAITDSTILVNAYTTGSFFLHLNDGTIDMLPIKDRYNNLSLYRENEMIWIGKYFHNIMRYNSKTEQYQTFPLPNGFTEEYYGSSICRLNDSILWIGSRLGIIQINEYQQSSKWHLLKDTVINHWHTNAEGIWAATDQGLVQFDSSGKWQANHKITGDATNNISIQYIHEDRENIFWLACKQGLVRWNPKNNKWRRYTTADGLSNNYVYAALEDNSGHLWLPSNYGLMKFRKSDAYVTSYFKKDGLPNNEFNFKAHYQFSSGLIILGGLSGLVSFFPDDVGQVKAENINLQIGEVLTFDRQTETSVNHTKDAYKEKQLIIQPNENRLEIQLVPHFLRKRRIAYEWRLPAESDRWNTLQEPRLQLNQLSYGTYNLEFRAYFIGNTAKKASILSLQIIAVRPFYLRWWFIAVLILSFGLLVLWYFSLRQHQILTRNKELEQEVDQQTKELQKKLITINQQTKELKKIDEIKSRFFINVSHELRTPLSLILGPVSKLIKEDLTEKQIAQLHRIKRNAKQLRQLTEEILDLARLEAGKLEIHEETIHFNAFTKRVFAAYTSLAEYRNISYELDLKTPKGLKIKLDVLKLERIINNLLTNALKFCNEGDRVIMKTRVTKKELQFEVEDTGIGISFEDLPKIFDRYYQARHQEMPENGGLGIGLAMSKELTLLLGGTIQAKSTLGTGTSIKLTIPAVVVEHKTVKLKDSLPSEKPIQNQSIKEVVVAQKTPHTNTISNHSEILLVEDNEELLSYLTELLSISYTVQQARNGKEALEFIEKKSIDLIISDVMMPIMNGFELLKTVRNQPQKWGIPFILLTARSERPDQLYGLRLGVDAYLSKPFEQDELLARVKNLLENQKKRKSSYHTASAKGLISIITDSNKDMSSFDDNWLADLEKKLFKRIKHSNLKIADLAEDMIMSERSFRDKLKNCTGLKPSQYILQARLQLAYQLLNHKRYPTVAEVVYAVGMNSTAYFSKTFKGQYGVSPSELLK